MPLLRPTSDIEAVINKLEIEVTYLRLRLDASTSPQERQGILKSGLCAIGDKVRALGNAITDWESTSELTTSNKKS